MTPTQLLEAIKKKTARVGIVGMGYVGLPLVRVFCEAGFRVTGFDVDLVKVRKLKAGQSYIEHIPSKTVAHMVRKSGFEATRWEDGVPDWRALGLPVVVYDHRCAGGVASCPSTRW